MTVEKTDQWLKEFIKKRTEAEKREYIDLQRMLLCDPVAEHFKEYTSVQLHKYFLENGLFYPDANISNDIEELEEKQVWKLLQNHYLKLKKAWDGARADIFIFPVEKRNEMIMEQLNGKMGISFHNVIVLFIANELSKEEIFALLTHEYNHVCRLSNLKKQFHELTLLDSMLIEGMAEISVEKTLGKRFLAPWVSIYKKKDLQPFWQRVKRLLNLQGKDKHNPILYGETGYRGFPKWFGYSTGYFIVQEYLERNKQTSISELLKMESEDILKGSNYDS